MDGRLGIEKNHAALKRILAELAAMAGLTDAAAFTSPLWGGRRSSDRRVGVIAIDPPPPHKGEVKTLHSKTLPRRLYLAVLKLLRPAESAARRLIIAAARGMSVTLAPRARKRDSRPKPNVKAHAAALRTLGIAIVLSPEQIAAEAKAARVKARAKARAAARAGRPPNFLLLDPIRRPFRRRRPRQIGMPRIGWDARSFVPQHRAPSPDDSIDATRLGLRLTALAAALDDLPGQAMRFARWRAVRDAAVAHNKCRDAALAHDKSRDASRDAEGAQGPNAQDKERDAAAVRNGELRAIVRVRRLSPLRAGRPPGSRKTGRRREIDAVLAHAHELAVYALAYPDTS